MLINIIDYFSQVSMIFWLIITLSCLMWGLIGIAYLTQRQDRQSLTERYLLLWAELQKKGLANDASHNCLTNLFTQHMHSYLNMINAMASVLPLLGLLGTVNGMIQAFQVMADNVAGQHFFSGGIASALLTTLAGLVTALSGVLFHHHLQQRAQQLSLTFSQSLTRN